MSDRVYYVYALFRTGHFDPFYIGKGAGDRLAHHERLARAGRRMSCTVRIRQIWSEGGSVEAVKLIDGLSEAVAYEIEATLIRLIGREPLGPLVNLANGGDWGLTPEAIERRTAPRRGKPRSPEVRAKISAAKLGKKRPPEVVAKIAAKLRGRPMGEAQRQGLIKANTGRNPGPNAFDVGGLWRGKPMPPEFRAKLSEAAKRRMQRPEERERIRAQRIGTKHSMETRAKMRASHQRKFNGKI